MYIILKGSVLIKKKSISEILGEIPFITKYDGESFGEQEILFSSEVEGEISK
jgi:hypothetical protein